MDVIHVRAKHTQNNSTDLIYHETDDQSVVITSDNNSLPNGVETLSDLVDNLGEMAFSDEGGSGIDQNAVHKTGDENIAGNKNFTNQLLINGVPVSYDSNSKVLTFGTPQVVTISFHPQNISFSIRNKRVYNGISHYTATLLDDNYIVDVSTTIPEGTIGDLYEDNEHVWWFVYDDNDSEVSVGISGATYDIDDGSE